MSIPHLLDTKVINYQCALDGARDVFPEAWCELCLMVYIHSEAPHQEMVCKDARLG
jgi:hypothetical protein